jgi:Resolvase, N terminal domain
MTTGKSKQVRCAVYTRVSTDQGLEQDFNSLDAQYDASQAYIRSQQHAGWTMVRAKYDDGGFSGGNTDRPALQRLLARISHTIFARSAVLRNGAVAVPRIMPRGGVRRRGSGGTFAGWAANEWWAWG